MENLFIGDSEYCHFCQKPFKGDEKPFFPVKSLTAYHWKCYIKQVKEQQVPVYSLEEEYEERYNNL